MKRVSMKRIQLTEEDAREILSTGEIPERIRNSSPFVAVILTQGWCPQWKAMNAYLDQWCQGGSRADGENASSTTEKPAVFVYHLVYDTLPFFNRFLVWKENTFKNYDIPYVRYYQEGKFVGESNFVDLDGFKSLLMRKREKDETNSRSA
jgi:hypothetical protein